MTASETQQEHVQAMGPELGTWFHALWNDLVWVNLKWQEMGALYAQPPERLDLLNYVAPHFFRELQDIIWRDVLLHLARMTDPPKSVGKRNLTIQALPELIHDDDSLAAELSALIEDAIRQSEFVTHWRNRRLAHNDVALKLKQPAKPLPLASRADVDNALNAIGRVLRRLYAKYFPSSELMFGPVPIHGGVDALIAYIELGVQAEQQRRERREPMDASPVEHSADAPGQAR